jgi:Transposase, Mutator family
VRTALEEVLEAEMTEALSAEKGERTAGRQGYRSGYSMQTLVSLTETSKPACVMIVSSLVQSQSEEMPISRGAGCRRAARIPHLDARNSRLRRKSREK